MFPENYRYYCLDRAGRVHTADWFDAADDEDAIAQIKAKHGEATCEIWEAKRLVAKLSPTRPST